jgi:uncharacterized protein (TIGR02217 family)
MIFLESPVFPIDLAYETEGGPQYLTQIVEFPSGREVRNAPRNVPKYRFDAASGIQTEEDLYKLLTHFHVVGGQHIGWRLRNWGDYKSCAPYGTPTALDQLLCVATSGQTAFQLVKRYTFGALERVIEITKPVANTVLISVNDVVQEVGWTVDTTNGIVTFDSGLQAGDAVKAGFLFDLPCRYGTDYLPRRFKSYMTGEVEVPVVSYLPSEGA